MANEKLLIDLRNIDMNEVDTSDCTDVEDILSAVITYLSERPIVDAVEVVHAEWLDIRFDPMWRSMLATCSRCKVRGEVRVKSNECGFAVPDSNHCPNCGARMDGEGNG